MPLSKYPHHCARQVKVFWVLVQNIEYSHETLTLYALNRATAAYCDKVYDAQSRIVTDYERDTVKYYNHNYDCS